MITINVIKNWIYSHYKILFSCIAAYYVVAVAIILGGTIAAPSQYNQKTTGDIPLSATFRIVEDGKEVSSAGLLPYTPGSKDVKTVELFCSVPSTDFSNMVLVTTLYQTQLEVWIDGENIYQSPGIPGGWEKFTPGSPRISVPMTEDFAGKELHLIYTRLVPSDVSSIQPLSLENPVFSASMQTSLQQKILFFVLSTMVCVGIALVLVSVAMDPHSFLIRPLFYLALVIISAPIWLLCNAKLAQFFTLNYVLLHNLEYISFYFFLIPIWIFIWLNWNFCPRIIHPVLSAMVVFNLLAVSAELFGFADLYVFSGIYRLVLLANAVLMGGCALLSRRSRDVSLRLFFNGLFWAGCAGIADLIRFYYFPEFHVMFFAIGLIGMGACVVASFISISKQKVQLQIENNVFREMAYTDRLTRVKNRQAFEEDIAGLETEEQHQKLLIVNLDINCFKQINDTYGHLAGDHVLKVVSQHLESAVRGLGSCYRMGGDEFCLIIKGESVEYMVSLLRQVNEKLAHCMEEGPVSVAYGVAEFDRGVHQNLMEVFKDADDRMYLNKRGGDCP